MARLQQKIDMDFYERIHGKLQRIFASLKEETDSEKRAQMLEEAMTLLEKQGKRIDALTAKGCGKAWDFTKEKARTVFAEDEHIILRYCQPEEKDMYIQIKRENSDSPDFYEKEEMVKSSWGIFQAEHSLVCSIIRKSDKRFIGYISIKDTRVNLWEIAIELLQEHCHKGYGTKAIPLLVNEVSKITSKKQFQALVETDNIPSQLLMEKVGAKLIDIYDYSFYGDEEAASAFEEKHLEEITDRMLELAERIDVEPRKMLSHVLDYRIYAE